MSCFELLLRLYPLNFRSRFASEMLAAHREALADQRLLGDSALGSFLVKELGGVAFGAFWEWAELWRTAGQKLLQRSGDVVHVVTAICLASASGALLFASVLPIGPVTDALERPFFLRMAMDCLLSAAAIEVTAVLFQKAVTWEGK